MKKPSKKKRKSWLKKLIQICGVLFGFCILFILSIYLGLWGKIPTKKDLSELKQAESSLVLDHNEKMIGKYFVFDRQIVQYDKLPKHLVDGLIATEDARFYEHHGIDYTSFFRVFIKSLILQDDSSGGGSTITQQLAKNLYGRKNYGPFSMPVNKIKEMITALRIEDVYSKQDIIELYLNTVPFSENTFGIESASQKFFNTSAQQLDLSQSSTLVGTLKANHSYNPRLFPERSQLRRDVVLQQMEKYGYIDTDTRFAISNQPLEIDYHKYSYNEGLAPYFRERVRLQVEKILDTIEKDDGSKYDLFKDGLIITTTLDRAMQDYAEKAMLKHMAKLQDQFEKSYGKNGPWNRDDMVLNMTKKLSDNVKKRNKKLKEDQIMESFRKKEKKSLFTYEGDTIRDMSTIDSLKYYLKFLNAGFLAVEPESGAVKAYVGGINFEHFKFDHVMMGKRQIGSTFKPFVYTTAIESGMDPCTYISVNEITYTNEEGWTPSNASKDEVDPHMNYSLEKALSNSVNTIAVKVLDRVGIDAVIEQAKKMGIYSELPKVPSLALGTAEMSLMELTSAYTGFVNRGISSKPFLIEKIEDKHGKVIFEYKPKNKDVEPAYSESTRETMIEFMKATVNEGTARRIRSTYGLQNDMAGKTGTTQNNKDGWFVGITPNLVMASWVGHDDHRIGFNSTALGQGANSALPIVANFLGSLNRNSDFNTITRAKFGKPSNEVLESLDCNPEKRDGFFKRLFGKKKKEKEFGE